MGQQNYGIWGTLLVLSMLVFLYSFASLPNLYENISGDNIPNRPQGEPPIVYRWDLATIRIISAAVSFAVGAYSFKRIRQARVRMTAI